MWVVVELIIVPVTFVVTMVFLGILDNFSVGAALLGLALVTFIVASALVLLKFALQHERDADVGLAAQRPASVPRPATVGVVPARLVSERSVDDGLGGDWERARVSVSDPLESPLASDPPLPADFTSPRDEPGHAPH